MNTTEDRTTIRNIISKAQVCGLQNNPAVDDLSRSLIRIADQEKRMLTDVEIISICSHASTNPTAISSTIRNAAHYVDRCKQTLVTEQPQLFQEGGALHPVERSEACWRDCWNFLRVASYAMAVGTPQCTDTAGIRFVRQLYELMNVPVSGMNLALSALSQMITRDLRRQNHQAEAECIAMAFTEMRRALYKD